ncbi:MAG: vitamin K epoxide reductase family protein [Chloroflexi bacterium]|nr:vitamin K epoxide reductase family protein [Chloroflexota bacterium]
MSRRFCHSLVLLVGVIAFLSVARPLPVLADEPVVRAVLYYSPTCAHCHQVVEQDLPPSLDKYGTRLQILAVDVTEPAGQSLYQAAVVQFKIPDDRIGVPTLIVDHVVLVGSLEIPERLPGLVERYLAQGGTNWPNIPGLAEVLPEVPTPTTPAAADPELQESNAPIDTATLAPSALRAAVDAGTRLARDPIGNGAAVVVLIGMLTMVVRVALFWSRKVTTGKALPAWRERAVPILALVGVGVAAYLAYVETAHVAAVCGPVGDCNMVQQSEYARLFGSVPIGTLGLFGYTAVLAAWLVGRLARGGPLADWAALALFITAFGGTLFSIYLTFLEPFVIGATCAWCLTSAVVMSALLWLSEAPARRVRSNRSVASAG